jgi:PAS domain S-box-containing protein
MGSELRRILIVDDSDEDREHFKRLLTKSANWNWMFSEANTGEKGLALAVSGEPFECILLDYRLRDMDGTDFLEQLRARQGKSGIATIMMAGVGDEAVAVRAMKLGAQDYLSKGNLNSDALFRAVENAISHYQLNLSHLKSVQALAESEERYRGLVAALPQIVWTVTLEGSLDLASPNWFALLGVTPEEFQRCGWECLLSEDDLQEFAQAWTRGLRAGQAFEIEHRLRQAGDAGFRLYLSRAVPIRDEYGELLKWIGTSTDIEDSRKAELAVLREQQLETDTARKQAEAALLKAGALQNAIYHSETFRASQPMRKALFRSSMWALSACSATPPVKW